MDRFIILEKPDVEGHLCVFQSQRMLLKNNLNKHYLRVQESKQLSNKHLWIYKEKYKQYKFKNQWNHSQKLRDSYNITLKQKKAKNILEPHQKILQLRNQEKELFKLMRKFKKLKPNLLLHLRVLFH